MTQIPIGDLFHLTTVVGDLARADDWYRSILGAHSLYSGYDPDQQERTSLMQFAEIVVESIQPAAPSDGGQTPAGRFYSRHGPSGYGVAWYVDDVSVVHQHLTRAGVRLSDVHGLVHTGTSRQGAVFTHPKDTGVLLEFAQPGYIDDPRLQPNWSPDYWRDKHPLQLSGGFTIHIKGDMQRLRSLFTDVLGGSVRRCEDGTSRNSVVIAVGSNTVVRLEEADGVSTTDPQTRTDGVQALALGCSDLDAAQTYLASKGLQVSREAQHLSITNSQKLLGLAILLAGE